MDDTLHNLTNQLLDCQEERGRLNDEGESLRAQIKRLEEQITKLEQQRKIAHANGFEEGYKACQRDARQGGHR